MFYQIRYKINFTKKCKINAPIISLLQNFIKNCKIIYRYEKNNEPIDFAKGQNSEA